MAGATDYFGDDSTTMEAVLLVATKERRVTGEGSCGLKPLQANVVMKT